MYESIAASQKRKEKKSSIWLVIGKKRTAVWEKGGQKHEERMNLTKLQS